MRKLTRKLMKEIGIKNMMIDTAIMGNYIIIVEWNDGKKEKYVPRG